MAEYKKYVVEIGTNGHIKYRGKLIAVLAAWCRYEDLDEAISLIETEIKKRNEKLHEV